LAGIAVLTYYAEQGCGPMASGKVYTSNQIIPYFVINVVNYPGTAGLFVAAIVASTLSSISSAQNAVGIIFWKGILTRYKIIENASELKKTIILKVIVLIFGIIIIVVAFAAMFAGDTLMHAASAVLGTIGSPILGLFLLGGSNSFVSAKSAIIAVFCAIGFLIWVSMGKLFYGNLWEKPIEISDRCDIYNNVTSANDLFSNNFTHAAISESYTMETLMVDERNSFLLNLYSLSSFSYQSIGALFTFTLGMLLSTFPCLRHRKPVEKIYIFPFLRGFVGVDTLQITAGKTEQKRQNINYTPVRVSKSKS
jgi:hypothetical protein